MIVRTAVRLRLAGVILATSVAAAACGSSAATLAPASPVAAAAADSPSAASATAEASQAPASSPSAQSFAPDASTSPSPDASASPSPDPSASASPTASPGATPFVIAQFGDPAGVLTIDPGYTFVKLSAKDAASLMSLVSSSLQSSRWKVDVGVRAVDKAGALLGYLMVGRFPVGVLTAAIYQQALAKMASTMGVTISSTTIDGHVVATGHLGAVSIMAYHAGDAMIGTIGQTAAKARAVITALIAANP